MKGARHTCTEIVFNSKPNKNGEINSSYAPWLWGYQVEYKKYRQPNRGNNKGLLIIPISSTCFGR
jgi:hypothetical protein